MPELPEVETVKESLKLRLNKKKITVTTPKRVSKAYPILFKK